MNVSGFKAAPNNNTPAFKGFYNNKIVLNTLEKISDHGASFSAMTSFVMAAGVRPLSISLAPKTDKENKQYAISNSIGSALMKFAIAETVAIPIENAIKKIDKNPEKYLKKETIEKLGANNAYKFAGQVIKLGANFISAIPKSLITVALIPIVMDKIFKFDPKNKKNKEINPPPIFKQKYDPIFNKVTKQPSFKGNIAEKAAAGIMNNKKFVDLITGHNFNPANTARNISVATDILLTATQAIKTKTSKKIDEERKNPLIYNNIIATGISILGGCTVDKAIQKGTQKQIEKFIEANKNNPKLSKYIEGINILRPTIVFALIYYGILPMFTTSLADKIDKYTKEH